MFQRYFVYRKNFFLRAAPAVALVATLFVLPGCGPIGNAQQQAEMEALRLDWRANVRHPVYSSLISGEQRGFWRPIDGTWCDTRTKEPRKHPGWELR